MTAAIRIAQQVNDSRKNLHRKEEIYTRWYKETYLKPEKDKRALLTFHLHSHHSSSHQTSTLSSRHVSKSDRENFSHFTLSTCAPQLACICVNELCPLNFKKSSLPSSRSELLPSKSCGLLSDSSSAKMNWGRKRDKNTNKRWKISVEIISSLGKVNGMDYGEKMDKAEEKIYKKIQMNRWSCFQLN